MPFRKFASVAILLTGNFLFAAGARADDSLATSMQAELTRSFDKLKSTGEVPVYFLSYRINNNLTYNLSAKNGTLVNLQHPTLSRAFHVEVRVGCPKFDNTHNSKECSCEDGEIKFYEIPSAPLENDSLAVRHALWGLTETAYKKALEDYAREHASKMVDVQRQDSSNDFSMQSKHVFSEPARKFDVDEKKWQSRLREWSAEFNKYPGILHSEVRLQAEENRVYYISSEGTQIERNDPYYYIQIYAWSKLPDGMDVYLYDNLQAHDLNGLDSAEVKTKIEKLANSVQKLSLAKTAEPYAGPAILRGKAAAVFFHEVFGHRAEGHRQKDEDEGQTFTKKLGLKIMPSFISVLDDPTLEKYHGVSLSGQYKFDDEGVPAQKVVLVDHGVLKGFLMSRSPIRGFSTSNGHGRCDSAYRPVARQGNLLIVADEKKEVPYSELRKQLLAQVRQQKKSYGLIFDEIAGGSTFTETGSTQNFALLPLRVWRVYADGRPDELMRGADIVGTPLSALESIISASSDVQTFNGVCGAESGWVPVSASSPSLLVRTIEIQKQAKSTSKPPALPPPPDQPSTTNTAAME